jgi:hypothetical protein
MDFSSGPAGGLGAMQAQAMQGYGLPQGASFRPNSMPAFQAPMFRGAPAAPPPSMSAGQAPAPAPSGPPQVGEMWPGVRPSQLYAPQQDSNTAAGLGAYLLNRVAPQAIAVPPPVAQSQGDGGASIAALIAQQAQTQALTQQALGQMGQGGIKGGKGAAAPGDGTQQIVEARSRLSDNRDQWGQNEGDARSVNPRFSDDDRFTSSSIW